MTQPLAPPEPHPALLFAQWAQAVDQQNAYRDLKLDTLSGDLRSLRTTVDHVATSLEELKILVNVRFNGIRGEITEIRGEINEIRSEINELRTEFHAKINTLDTEVGEIKSMMTRVLVLMSDKPAG